MNTIRRGETVFLQLCNQDDLGTRLVENNTDLRLYLSYSVLDNHFKYTVDRSLTLGSIRTFQTIKNKIKKTF